MKGFTLVEVLITLLILSVLCGALVAIFAAGKNTYDAGMASSDLQASARQAIESMNRELRQGSRSSVSILNGTQITFRVPTDITVIPSAMSDPITYYVDANQLLREHPTGTTRVIATHISRISFSLNGDLLLIELDAGKTVRQRDYSVLLTEQLRIRN